MLQRVLILMVCCITAVQLSGQEGEVLDLKVQGTKRLKPSFIKLISDIKPGVALDSAVINQDIIRLKRLPAVAHAYFQVFKSHDNFYNVFYNVEENITINPQVNLYTTNDDEFAYRPKISMEVLLYL